VFLQGIFAYLLFTVIPNKRISALLLGVITLSLSAFQKVFVLTVLFGNTLWESIDTFGNYVSSELFWINGDTNFQLSYVLIGVYGTIHLLGGIIFGLIAGKTPKWISENSDKVYEYNEQFHHKDEILDLQKKKKKNVWWKRKSTLIIGLFSLTMVIISYLNPELGDNLAFQIVIMLVRSIVITYVWFGLISPILIRWVKKYLLKKKSEYSKEINEILALFPYFKGIINYSWRKTNHKKNYKRILPFLTNSFLLLLMADINLNEKDNTV
jgi:antibiotic biosynthesis monooxygenase (ABM) superfamily enzyme